MRDTFTAYEVLEIPATGAYGVVCIARDPDEREVAIKVLQLDQATRSGLLQRARDEARMLSRLRHPNLVRVDPVLSVNGRPAIVMEYVRGATARQLLRAHPEGLPVAVALRIVHDAALGLEAAWSTPIGSKNEPMRIVHRDVKPGNLMLDVHGVVKVVDFGLAKGSFDDREAHSIAFVPGSRGYMAPERFDGEDSPKGDVYALGLTLFELLVGKKAVVSLRWDKHDDDVARSVQALELTELGEPCRDAVRELIASMCAYEDEERPWPAEVAARVARILEGIGPVDLAAYAAEVVGPLHASRERVPPQDHPRWSEVRFLEVEPTAEGEPLDVSAAVRRAVRRPDFPEHAQELAALIAAHPDADISPLVSVLDLASAPPWQFWRKPPPTARTVAALKALKPLRRHVVRQATRLSRHRDPDVRSAALAILDQA